MDILIQFAIWVLVFTPSECLLSFYPIILAGRERRQNILLALFNNYVTAFLLAAITFGIVKALDGRIPGGIGAALRSQPYLVQVIEAALLIDLGIYVSHRMSHSRLLWRFHEVHHSAEEMNWLVAFRFHPIDLMLYSLMSSLPVVLLGFSLEAVALAKAIHAWQACFSHANVKIGLGPLRHLFVGPKFHHWHHANERAAYNRNFGGLFVAWDWLFGTLHKPARERAEMFGTDGRRYDGLVDMLAGPFQESMPSEELKSSAQAPTPRADMADGPQRDFARGPSPASI